MRRSQRQSTKTRSKKFERVFYASRGSARFGYAQPDKAEGLSGHSWKVPI
jgi:hypothetical protein